MDFIIQNIGWFVGIAIVIILALIGSYADKKEKKQLANNKQPEPNKIDEYEIPEANNEPYQYQSVERTITQEEQIQPLNSEQTDIDESLYAPLENTTTNLEQQETVDPSLYAPLESLSVPTISESTITDQLQQINEISQQQTVEQPINEPAMEFNNIENLNMSLEDLEKKNYDKILNKKIEQEELMPDFTNSEDYLDETLASENFNHIFDNEIEQNQEEQNENITENMQELEETQEIAKTQNALEEESNENNSNENTSQVNNNDVTEPTIENKENVEENTPKNDDIQPSSNTDEEIQNSNEQQENMWEFNTSPQLNGEALELFNQIEQPISQDEEINHLENNIQEQDNLNLYNDQLDDDIWKF